MKYQNPIIKGFHPDPSICRVGRDFYLVTSSFEYFPGIPVYHSRDLVNWEQIGNCIERPGMLPYEKALTGGGVWAPTIRYHKGRFYVTAPFMEYGNFIVSSQDPASGWSDPVKVDMGGIDPSILFDGDKAYYCTNYRVDQSMETISLAEIDADTGALRSDIRPIWKGCSGDRPQYLEAPHLYHIGDWYYLLAAEGGTGQHHMITGARSRSVWGPYETLENNPLLTNRYSAGDVSCSGHGDLVEDADGNWWVVHLAMRPCDDWYSHLGRETFLLPAVWKDGSLYIADQKSHLTYDAPLSAAQKAAGGFTADFRTIQPQWLFLREPEKERYEFDGRLTLKPSRRKLSDKEGSPSLLAVRQADLACTAEAEFAFAPACEGDEAGLTIFLSCEGHYCFCKKRENGADYVMVYKNGGKVLSRHSVGEGTLTFKIVASRKEYALYYSVDGAKEQEAAVIAPLTREDAGRCFTGTLIGLYAQSDHETTAVSVISGFCMR